MDNNNDRDEARELLRRNTLDVKALDISGGCCTKSFSLLIGLLVGVLALSLWARGLCWANQSLLSWQHHIKNSTFDVYFVLLMIFKIVFSTLMICAATFCIPKEGPYCDDDDDDDDATSNTENRNTKNRNTKSVAESTPAFSRSVVSVVVTGRIRPYNFTMGLLFGVCVASMLVDTIGICMGDPICGVFMMTQ